MWFGKFKLLMMCSNWDPNDPYVNIQERGYCQFGATGCESIIATGSPSNFFVLFGYSTA